MAWMVSICWIEVRDTNTRVEPIGEEGALDAPRIGHKPVRIVQPVIGGDAGQMRRVLNTHEPLRHAVVGLADPAYLAIGPGLATDPLNDVVKVLLLSATEKFKFSLGNSGSAHVGVNVGVALVRIPLDRPGFSPEKKRRGRENVIVVPIGRACKKRGERAGAVRPIYPNRHFGSIPNGDGHIFFFNHLRSSRTVRLSGIGRT